ncbi:MAG: Fic family protein [Turicibacter sp.]|nr:Fic family protein [Turicibacter sp.]
MTEMLLKIDQLKNTLDNHPPFTKGELNRFREHFMVEYTYNSNAIEGNTLTLHETRLVLLEGLTIDKKPLKHHLDVVGHRDAFNYIVDLSSNKELLNERTIQEIHTLVLMDSPQDRGKYRQVPVSIIGALDTPPNPIDIPFHMKNLLNTYHADKHHIIKKIADFHIQFEHIHPFIDGNGRTGRLILNLELIKADYPPVNIKFKDRELYISCFRDYSQTGNADKFLGMLLQYQLEELTNLLDIVQIKQSCLH